MPTTWILVANSSKAYLYQGHRARLFRANGQDDAGVTLIKTYDHTESRLKTGDLVSDKLGSYVSRGHGSFSEMTDPKEHEAENFAKELVNDLDMGRKKARFDDLVLIATPHFSGLIQQNLSNPLEKMLVNTIEKDYTHMKKRELVQALKDQL